MYAHIRSVALSTFAEKNSNAALKSLNSLLYVCSSLKTSCLNSSKVEITNSLVIAVVEDLTLLTDEVSLQVSHVHLERVLLAELTQLL